LNKRMLSALRQACEGGFQCEGGRATLSVAGSKRAGRPRSQGQLWVDAITVFQSRSVQILAGRLSLSPPIEVR
jgi:hypothetical protein